MIRLLEKKFVANKLFDILKVVAGLEGTFPKYSSWQELAIWQQSPRLQEFTENYSNKNENYSIHS